MVKNKRSWVIKGKLKNGKEVEMVKMNKFVTKLTKEAFNLK